jgi:hypothetical protein
MTVAVISMPYLGRGKVVGAGPRFVSAASAPVFRYALIAAK